VAVRSVHHVNIRADAQQIAQLRRFYSEVLGLTEGWRPPFASRGAWLYAGALPVLHLVEVEADQSQAARGGVIDHVAFECSDLQPFIDRLRARGVAYAVSQLPVLHDAQVLFRDPLGTGVELTVTARR
jgi:catechol 2,3-dioxygenase-like lactoylglutathione lyase family enzyme